MNGLANKFQIVELPIVANTTLTRFQFTTQNFLRSSGIEILSMETFSVNDLAFSPIGNTLPTTANLKSCYVTFYGSDPEKPDAKGDWLQQIPLVALHRVNNQTDPFVFEQYWQIPRNITWEKSFIECKDPAGMGNTAALSFVFNVGYQGIVTA